jgi:uncharacterized LabA/DUF88 family protein
MASYLFIDGGYLRKHFNEQMQTSYGVVPAVDFELLAASFKSERTYYYDPIDFERHATEADDGFQARVAQAEGVHDHINSLQGFHVREGHVRRSPKRRNREQKAVDVQLAVYALEHAARGNMKLMMLLAGDLDFEPLLTSLERLGVRTRLIYVPQHTSKELMQAADETRKVTLEHFRAWSAPSFRENVRTVKLLYREPVPEAAIFRPVKRIMAAAKRDLVQGHQRLGSASVCRTRRRAHRAELLAGAP